MTENEEMYVTKRNGEREIVSFDKILQRIKNTGQEANIQLNYTMLAMKVIDQLYDGISTSQIDELTSEQCASLASTHPDYNILAGRIVVSNLQKNTHSEFVKVVNDLYHFRDSHDKQCPIVSDKQYISVQKNSEKIEEMIDYERDYLIDYFGFKTLERAYLLRINKKIVERPQHMWMRVAIGIHGDDLERVKESYDAMSQKYFTHATPTLFNAGTPRPQLSSCFLIAMEDDSIQGIYNTLKDCANISKWAGGIGLHIHNIRSTGTHIRGTNGTSNGIVPMLRVFNTTAKYVDQCVTPETIVYTTQGPKEIQHCEAGVTDILNASGQMETIENVLEHYYEGPMLNIYTLHSIKPLSITPEHPIYGITGQVKGLKYSVIKNRLEKKLAVMDYIEAKDVDESTMIAYSIPEYEKDDSHIHADDCYFYGILLGDGCVYPTNANSGYVSMHSENKQNVKDFLIHYFEKRCIEYFVEEHNHTTRIRWNKNLQLPFRYHDIYNENKEKRMLSRWLHLPLYKAEQIIRGLLDTDGCMSAKELVFDNTSYHLIENLRYLCLRMGILTSGLERNRVGNSHVSCYGSVIEHKKINYVLRIPKTREMCSLLECAYKDDQFFKFFRYENFLFTRVQKIENTEYKGTLYDLQMTKEHNYTLHNGIVHNGGGKRNGSFAIYLEPWHGDIEVFLQMRKNHGDEELKARDLFYGLWIPDLFMERVKTNSTWTLMCPDECPGLSDVYGDEFKELYERYESQGRGKKTMQARDLWFQILDAQMETGTPYLCYKDAANRKSNQKNIGIIKSSNLCVAPETPILTQQGHICIESLVGQHVDVWNGTEFSNVEIIQTGENQELVEVKTSDGRSLTCTPYHKFYIQDSYHSKKPLIVEAKDLQVNQKLVKCEYPLIDGKEPMKYSYTHGFFCGDGTYYNNQTNEEKCKFKAQEGNSFCKRHQDQNTIISTHENSDYCIGISNKKRPKISLYDAKKELVEYMDYISKSGNNTRLDLVLPIDLAEKFFVPHQASLQEKLEWFAGYSDADGAVIKNGNNCSLQIGSIEKDFLLEVQLMLQTCGIHPKVTKMRDATQHNLPNGKGGHESYMTKPLYRLLVSSWDIYFLKTLGFTTRRLIFPAILPQRSAKQFVKIVSVTPLERRDNTYCFHEPKKNAGIFNGMYTSQCTEIMEVSTSKETAVCNLASIALPSFVDTSTQPPSYNFEKLHEISKIVTNNLNKVIDVNFYPTEKTNTSNMRHRPIGIGVQGLADTFIQMGYTFESEEAKTLNKHIFETIYHGALEKSCEIATVDGPYETFYGSPAANGVLQFDMWNVEPTQERYDWVGLKEKIKNNGLANSLLMAPMPTASTSQILGYNECIEPITSNIYSRRTLAGEFIMANKYLMRDLLDLGLWNEKIKNNIIANNGSVQQIEMIPEDIRNKYKTVWEISMQSLIDMAADRGAYICQSQSLNLWMEDPNYSSMTSMHFYAWAKGLKTGIYYLRRRGRHQAQQFTIEPEKKENSGIQEDENEICEMCSS